MMDTDVISFHFYSFFVGGRGGSGQGVLSYYSSCWGGMRVPRLCPGRRSESLPGWRASEPFRHVLEAPLNPKP